MQRGMGYWYVVAFGAMLLLAIAPGTSAATACELVEQFRVSESSSEEYTMGAGGYYILKSGDDNYAIFNTPAGAPQRRIADCDNRAAVCGQTPKADWLFVCDRLGEQLIYKVGGNCKEKKTINVRVDLMRGDRVKFEAYDGKGADYIDVEIHECSADADDDGFIALLDGGDDCDDVDAAIHPGAAELCNAKDDNCDGQTDEGLGVAQFRDADEDTFGDPNQISQNCAPQEGYVANNTDCDDADAQVRPDAIEECGNSRDDNCDGEQDERAECGDAGKAICEAQGHTWVGPLADGDCCGNAPEEYFLARTLGLDFRSVTFPTGCWNSRPVPNDATVSISLLGEDIADWVEEPGTYADFRNLGEGGRDDFFVVGVDGATQGMLWQYVPELKANTPYALDLEIKTREDATAEVRLLTLTAADTVAGATAQVLRTVPPRTNFQQHNLLITPSGGTLFAIALTVDIPSGNRNAGAFFDNLELYHKPAVQVLNVEGEYLGCKVTDSSVLSTDDTNTPGQQRLVDNSADYCTTAGSWVCSYTNRWILGSNRNRTSAAPPGAEDYANTTFLPQECCSPSACWDGYRCVTEADLGSASATPTMIGDTAYLCVDGEWETAEEKEDPDGTEMGFCMPGDCFSASGGDRRCVPDGFWQADDYCDAGTWTSRTRMVALTLLDMAGASDYTLFCDSAVRAANALDYRDGFSAGKQAWNFLFGDIRPGFASVFLCDALPEGTPCANNLCVLRWQRDGEEVAAFGVSLNEPMGASFDYSILNLFPDARQSTSVGYYDYCDGAVARSAQADAYAGCAGKTGAVMGAPAKVWYDNRTQSVIYGEQDLIVGNPNLGQLFLAFLRNPFARITSFITNLFTSRGEEDYAFIINRVNDFRTMYLSRVGERLIRGVDERIGADRFTTVNFYGYRTNICRAVEAFCQENAASAVNSCFGRAVSCQPTVMDGEVVFNVEAKNLPESSAFWSGLTAAVRTADAAAPAGSVAFIPVIAAYNQAGSRLSSPLSIREPFTVQLESAAPAEIIGYTWEFGDGVAISTSDGAEQPSHRYMQAGTYTIRLTALDAFFAPHAANPIQVLVTAPCAVGDANGDGRVDCADVHCVERAAVGAAGCPYVALCGDVAPEIPDGTIDARDTAAVRTMAATECPNCGNGIRDLQETGLDCGGPYCANCPICTDGIANQDETDVDCGGAACAERCGEDAACSSTADCIAGLICRIGTCEA